MFEVQTRKRRRRSSRNRRREVRAAAVSVVAAIAVVAGFVAAALCLAPLKGARVAPLSAASETVLAHDLDLEPARDESPRAVYPFSVIPGGVYSAGEFAEAVATDRAVGAHYSDVTPAAMFVETVDAPREAYMSYRVGDQIYWTKRKLALHDGERVLSDGSVTIRARCGNRLSDEPMLPTSDGEPPLEAFDDPAPPVAAPVPVNGAGPKLPLSAVPFLELPLEPVPVSEPSGAVPSLGPMVPFGGIGIAIPGAGEKMVDRAEAPIEFWFPPTPVPGDGDGTHPGDGPWFNPPGDDHPSDGGPFGEPPVGVPTGSVTTTGEVPPPVVPEPTSLTLFGTGAAWLALKRYRQRHR